jgi:hypothetical protein
MVHEYRFDKLTLLSGTRSTALNRVLVHIQYSTRRANAETFGQGFTHAQVILLAQPNVPKRRSTPGGIVGTAPGAVKQRRLALPVAGASNRDAVGGFELITVLAARAFFDERFVESKQARHTLMTEMGHEHFGLPIEMNGSMAMLKEGLFTSAQKP